MPQPSVRTLRFLKLCNRPCQGCGSAPLRWNAARRSCCSGKQVTVGRRPSAAAGGGADVVLLGYTNAGRCSSTHKPSDSLTCSGEGGEKLLLLLLLHHSGPSAAPPQGGTSAALWTVEAALQRLSLQPAGGTEESLWVRDGFRLRLGEPV